MELAIPWTKIITKFELMLLDSQLCYGAEVDMSWLENKHITGLEHWLVHCHCSNQLSLQCIAARVFMKSLLSEFIQGSWFNKEFMEYRVKANTFASERILYVGSIVFRDIHLIYIKIAKDEDAKKILTMNLGEVVFCDCEYCFYGILICKNKCWKDWTMLNVCASRTSRLIKNMMMRCKLKRKLKNELKRQEGLKRMFTYDDCSLFCNHKRFR